MHLHSWCTENTLIRSGSDLENNNSYHLPGLGFSLQKCLPRCCLPEKSSKRLVNIPINNELDVSWLPSMSHEGQEPFSWVADLHKHFRRGRQRKRTGMVGGKQEETPVCRWSTPKWLSSRPQKVHPINPSLVSCNEGLLTHQAFSLLYSSCQNC